jgi:hypothetical protein
MTTIYNPLVQVPVQKIKLMNENDNLYRATFEKKAGWKGQEYGSYIDTIKKIPNASRFTQSEFLNPGNQPDEQNRRGNTHKHNLRKVDELYNQRRPIPLGHLYIKPQDTNIWFSNGKTHTLASRNNFNSDFVDGSFL